MIKCNVFVQISIYSLDTFKFLLNFQIFLKTDKNHLIISVIYEDIEFLEYIITNFQLSEVDGADFYGNNILSNLHNYLAQNL